MIRPASHTRAAALLVLVILAVACGARHGGPYTRPAPTSQRETAEVALVGSDASQADAATSSAPLSHECPAGMVFVEGDYCPAVRQTCKRWLDPASSPYHEYRCGEYAPSECRAPRTHKRFCIDRDEYVRPGDALPLANQSWTSAASLCEADNKRLCLESEWQFACEGEEMRPYPYGFVRDGTLCNIDQVNLGKPQTGLNDLRAPTSAYPQCLSPFGVHDMSGNVEEWATLDHGKAPDRSAMKGAWWLPGKNTCRAATLGHGEVYRGPQVGVRCCKDG